MSSATATPKPKLSIGTIAAVVLIVLIAAALRFYGLGRESLWYDELIMARLTAADAKTLLKEILAGRPPLYMSVAWVWTHLLGTSEVALRSLSAVLGLLAVPLTYLLGRRLFERPVALIGVMLMAVSAFQIYYSQEHRYYALYLLTSLASLYFLVRALQQPRWFDFAGFVVFSVLSYYTQFTAIFMVAATVGAVVLLWRSLMPRARMGYIIALVLIGVGVSSSLLREILWITDSTGSGTWHQAPPLWAPLKTTLHLLFLAQRYTPVGGLAAAAAVGLAALMWWAWRRGARRWATDLLQLPHQATRFAVRRRDGVILLACWWLLPMIAMTVVSQVKPMYVDRYLIATAPAVYLLIGAALVAARRVLHPAAALAALLVAMSGSVWTLHTHTLKDQWRETAAFLAGAARPDDVLAFASYRGDPVESRHVSENLRWYYPHRQQSVDVNLQHTPAQIVDQLRGSAANTGRVWLVAMVWADEDMPPDLATQLAAAAGDGCVQQVQDFYRAKLVLMQFSDRPAASTAATDRTAPTRLENAR